MIKILIVDIGEQQGGIENLIHNVVSNINKKDFCFDFLIYNNRCAYQDEYIKEKSKIYSIVSRRKNPIQHYLKLKKFFKVNSLTYDYVWIQTCSASNILAHKFSYKYSNAKVITHSHVSKAETRSKIHLMVTEFFHKKNRHKLIKYTDIIFTCSEDAKNYLFGRECNKKYYLINNGIDTSKYKYSIDKKNHNIENKGLSNDKIILGHVGRFSKIKNHKFIIQIFNELVNIEKNSRLILIGDGEEMENIKKISKELKLDEKIIFTGEISNILDYLSTFSAFIFPSFHEGLGLSVIEAQAMGIPCFINKDLPKELDITNLIHRIGLDETADKWAREIKRYAKINSSSTYLQNVIDNNYDIKEITCNVEKILKEFTHV